MKKKIVLSIAAISVAGLITGCGGGSSSSSSTSTPTATQPTAKSVKVVDGYIIGANVCDANGVCVTTDGNGSATAKFGNTALTSTGGYIDVNGNNQIDANDIKLPDTFTLKTPAGRSVISPITDLIANGADKTKLAQILGIDANVLCADPIATNNVELAKAIQIVYALKAENKEAALVAKINSFEPTEAANTDLPTMDKNTTIAQPKEETNTTPATTDLPPMKVVTTDLPTFGETTTVAPAENNTTASASQAQAKGSLATFANLAMSVAGDEAKTLITAVLNTTATNPVALEESIANLKKELIDTQTATQTQEMAETNTAQNTEVNTTQNTEVNTTQEMTETNTTQNTEVNTTQTKQQTTPPSVPTDLPPF